MLGLFWPIGAQTINHHLPAEEQLHHAGLALPF
jgi:hypothetical protein